MGGVGTRVKFFGPLTPEDLEKEINEWFGKQGKWFRLSEAITVRSWVTEGETVARLAVFYEEILPGQSPSLPGEDEAGK